MKIHVDQIKAEPQELNYTEDVAELNARLGAGVRDWRVADGLGVEVEHHRSGLDVFFQGTVRGRVVGICSRCLEEYTLALEQPFLYVLTPRVAAGEAATRLTADDIAQSYYDGEEIDLTPLVYEQTILALPTRPLCAEGCRGLCAGCGANLNAGPCGCPAARPDPRLAVLHALARGK